MRNGSSGRKNARAGAPMRGALLAGIAHGGAHFLQQHVAAGNLVAAQHGALELRDEQSARPGRKLAEKLPQPIEGQGA